MSNFLARCAAIGLVGGGFAATGDLGWLAAKGVRLVNARTIPSEEQAADAEADAAAPTPTTPTPAVSPPATDPFRSSPAPRPAVPAAHKPAPPSNGPERLDLATLRPGERVTFWIRRPDTARQPWIAFDIVDPAAGEALLCTPGMAARRVQIRAAGGDQPVVLKKGDALLITPVGPAHHGQAGGAALGPVTAIAIGRW